MNKVYFIKSLTPWMMDELIAFSKSTRFTVVIIRHPEEFYNESLKKLEKNGIIVSIKPFIKIPELRKIFFVIYFIFRNINKFLIGYSAVIGWKSVLWFLRLDLSYFEPPVSIHAQFATQATLISLMMKKYFKTNVKYFFTFHAYDIYFKNKWFEMLVNNSESALSISNYNIDYVKESYTKINFGQIKLSRLGVFKPKITNISGKKKFDKITVGFLSWFVEKKGISYLLEAIKIINSNYRDKFEFRIAGNGPLKNKIIAFISDNKLDNMVKYIGPIYSEAKDNFFNSLDIFILPSVSLKNDMDGIPVALMEAISFGVPIISTNITGIPEICINNYNGILIEEKSVEQIVEALVLMYNKDSFNHFAINAINLFDNYNIEVNSQNKIKILSW